MKLGLDDLNKFRKKPVDISKFIFFDGPALQIDDEPYLFLYFKYPENNINDMYRKIEKAYAFKKGKNNFIFKIFMPDDNLFTYFEVDFNKEDSK